MPRLDTFLTLGREQGCSDIHLTVGAPPLFRLYGELIPVKYRDLSHDELSMLLQEILTDSQSRTFETHQELDFAYSAEDIGRFRVNLFKKVGGIGATFRVIANEIPTLESMNLPAAVSKLTTVRQGLVLVTGATSMGKSSTLAAMVNHLNETQRLNIITLEDPIEFVHPCKKSLIKQREVGDHTGSFAEGIRDALRQDPDVILVGELRDSETISMAMVAAETGHLVLGTLHTTSATKTLDRLLDGLTDDKRAIGRLFLAQNLKGVVCQALVRSANGRAKIAMTEIMVMTDAIANLVLADKIFQVPANLQTGKDQGMHLMDQALLEALRKKEIDPDDAYHHATDKKQFQQFVARPDTVPKTALLAG